MERTIVLGRDLAGKDITLNPYSASHTVLTGRTRSGKSIQLYSMLAGLKGEPVKVAGIDPSGIVFNALGEHLGGSDWRVKTLADADRARAVISEIVAEMDRRIELLLARKLDKFTEFTSDFPLIIVVFEEYPGTLSALEAIDKASGAKPADRVETAIRSGVQRLALEGAKVGVRLWLVAQRADASLLTGVLRSQLTQRLTFSTDPDGLRMLHDGIEPEDVEVAQKFRPGQAFAEFAGTLPRTRYRADLLEYSHLVSTFAT